MAATNGSNTNAGMFSNCCVAKLSNVEYWGIDCLAFGAVNDCQTAMTELLTEMNYAPKALDWLALGGAQQFVQGTLMTDCPTLSCNTITSDFYVNSYTLEFTDQPICPVAESVSPGVECYVGPWQVTLNVNNPLTDCQDGSFDMNFCKNRKTMDGRPFVRCCTFAYINSQGLGKCNFTGLASGTCQSYVGLLQSALDVSAYTAISSPLVLNECTQDGCNDPTDAEIGCPSVVDYNPPQSAGIVSTAPPELQSVGSVPDDGPPWAVMGIVASGILLLMALAGLYYYNSLEKPEPLFHTAGAKVIAEDVFIEPSQDHVLGKMLHDAPNHGVVHPRPHALREILNEQRGVRLPQALRMPPQMVAAEAAVASYADYLNKEAEARGVDLRNAATADSLDMGVSPEVALALEAVAGMVGPHAAAQMTSMRGQLPGQPLDHPQPSPAGVLALCDDQDGGDAFAIEQATQQNAIMQQQIGVANAETELREQQDIVMHALVPRGPNTDDEAVTPWGVAPLILTDKELPALGQPALDGPSAPPEVIVAKRPPAAAKRQRFGYAQGGLPQSVT